MIEDPPAMTEDRILAAEYVMRLLDADETRRFETRMAVDPRLRGLIQDWEIRLLRLTEDITPVAPPATLRDEIERQISGELAVSNRGGGVVRSLPRQIAVVLTVILAMILALMLVTPAKTAAIGAPGAEALTADCQIL